MKYKQWETGEDKEIKAEGILSGFTSSKEKNVVTLSIKTDSLSPKDIAILRELYQTGKGVFKPKAKLKLIFDNKVHELLGKYKNAY